MKHFILFEDRAWKLERWGGGLSYALTDKREGRTLFMQGDDADEFERDFGVKEEYLAGADLCEALWENQGGEFVGR
jgi:hypothetical protein